MLLGTLRSLYGNNQQITQAFLSCAQRLNPRLRCVIQKQTPRQQVYTLVEILISVVYSVR